MVPPRPPLYVIAIALLMFVLDRYLPVMELSSVPVLGWTVIIAGLVAIVWIGKLFARSGTPIRPEQEPKRLITHGPYRFTRNPIYLSMVFMLFGAALIFGSLSAFLGPVIFLVVIDRFVVPIEERNLRKAFGKTYESYSSTVRRWI